MNARMWWQIAGLAVVCLAVPFQDDADGCCAVSRSWSGGGGGTVSLRGIVNPQPVVNADQEVIMIWDPAKKMQHFIRRANFKSTGDDDIGFLIPSPSKPELSEAGNEAFPFLAKVTAPEIIKKKAPRVAAGGGIGGGLGAAGGMGANGAIKATVPPPVRVLEEKRVAGFNAVVLEADSASALVDWLKKNEFVYSPEIEAWAKPYIEQKWKITALKVARTEKDPKAKQTKKSIKKTIAGGENAIKAGALRMSFATDRPLFPYREPDSTKFAESLGAKQRLLRIFFIAEAKYQGELTQESPWTGKVVWSGRMNGLQRKKMLEFLKLPLTTGPNVFYLTEFEDEWPYKVAPADLYFSKSTKQDNVRRPPVIHYVSTPQPQEESPKLTAGTR